MATEKVKGFSPVLDAILHGGSSVSINVIEMAKSFPKEKLLFRSTAMNGVVIFKFPNFVDEVGKELMGAFGGPAAIEYHPIETGVYIPYSTEAPQDGGCAIYMRQKNYQQLLMDYVGLPSDGLTDGANLNLSQDIKLLSLMDTIPSLDPFLLKECFDANGISYDPSVLRLDPREEEDIKRMISEKISPIVQKAFDSERTTSSRERLLSALWNPTMPEARNFVRAFGIADSEAVAVFTAWKGITFYQLQVRVIGPKIREVLGWMKSKESIPIDATINKTYMPQLQMFNVKIVSLINQNVADMRTILTKYENCFASFIDGNPSELTNFLRSARQVYYVLGYCISSLNSAIAIFFREIRPPTRTRISFEETNRLYIRLDTTLSRKRDVPTSL